MASTPLIPLHRPGDSPVHRMPVSAKFAVLLVLALALSLRREDPWIVAAAWALAVLGHLASGATAVALLRRLWGLRWLVLLLTVPQLIFLSGAETALNVARVTALILLAGLLTLTTSTEAVLDAVERALHPLRRLGVDPERVSLALSLTIRSVPTILGFHAEIRQAQRARGARGGPWTTIMPLLVMTLRHAERTAEALTARGVR